MKRWRPFLMILGAALLLGGTLSALYQRRLARDLFPEYSTLRADPLGLRALFGALSAVPDMQVERWVKPIEKIRPMPPQTIVLAGGWADQFDEVEPEAFNALEAAARAGSRVVIVFRAETAENIAEREEYEKFRREFREARKHGRKSDDAPDGDEKSDRRSDRRVERDRESPRSKFAAEKPPVDLTRVWGFTVKSRPATAENQKHPAPEFAQRTGDAPAALPAEVRWKTDRYLELNAGQGWTTLYRRAGEPVLAETSLGRGTIVVGTDSYFLSNEALQRDRSTRLLTWIVGGNSRVTFVETHLGVQENTGIAALARRYGLAPAGGLAIVLALLFVWRRAALFVPPMPEHEEVTLDYHPTAGLAALLRRALPPAKLVPTCLAEWRKTASATDTARLAGAAPHDGEHPVTAYNRLAQLLRRR